MRRSGDRAASIENTADGLFVDGAADGGPPDVEIADPSGRDPDELFALLQNFGPTAVDLTDFRPPAAA